MSRKKVVCLHVPYQRLVKHALSKPFIDLLSERFELRILAPFSVSDEDLEYLRLQNQQFLYYEANFTGRQQNLVRLIDYFRRSSFFSRNHDKLGLGTFANLLDGDGYPWVLRKLAKLSIRLRCDRPIWRLLDRICWRAYTPKPIAELDFDCDLFVQFSNWGINDFAIKNAKAVRKSNKVFFPYTTDQVYGTGYFLHEFEKIYCQSSVEYELLESLHNYKGSAGIAGSLWFRHVDFVLESGAISKQEVSPIIYTGVSGQFFPKSSEVRFVNCLNSQFPDDTIWYLPYFAPHETTEVLDEVGSGIRIVRPEEAITEIDAQTPVSVKHSVEKYLEKLWGAKLFVMSFNTSMGIDFSYLNKTKVFSYFYDDVGTIEKGAYSTMERRFFHGSNYHEIDSNYTFTPADFSIVDSPASDRWDANVELSDVVGELVDIV